MSIGEVIRIARKEKQISMRKLAEESGLGLQTIYNLENGRHSPRKVTIKLICNTLGISYEETMSKVGAGT